MCLYQPNLFFIVNKSKNIEVIERIKPNIIKDLDFSVVFSSGNFLEEYKFVPFFVFRRFENDLFTM